MAILTNITPADFGRLNDPEHWRDKAKDARIKAETMQDPIARRTMQGVVAKYELLAAQVAGQATAAPDAA